MNDTPFQLIRVNRSARGYQGEWRPLYFCPDPASPQEFVVGVGCEHDGRFDGWRLLGEFEKFECVYGKRLPAGALKPYFARVAEYLRAAEIDHAALPSVDHLSEQLRWGAPLAANGDTVATTLDDLFETVVAVLPEPASRSRATFKARNTDSVRRKVNERLKVLLQLRYEAVVNERGYEEIQADGIKHRLNVNLRAGKRVGTVVSAWYGSIDSVASQILQAEADLTTAVKHFGAREAGLFVVRPFDEPGLHDAVLSQIDEFMEDSRWRCGIRGNVFNADDDENRLAEAIAEFV
ncbi:MAG TPA: hypothetical protein VFS13_00740 [Steroidobacteraceae bacterium]|nr:hypothetical protein [Steroidobacteraceae bacterium]